MHYAIRIDGNSTPTIDFCDFNNLANAPYVMSVLSDPIIQASAQVAGSAWHGSAPSWGSHGERLHAPREDRRGEGPCHGGSERTGERGVPDRSRVRRDTRKTRP